MKIEIEVNSLGEIVLKEVYSGILMETSEGNKIGICMRDNTFEINVIPKEGMTQWHRVHMESSSIKVM